MLIKATWVSDNPFIPDVNKLSYTKTISVPDGTDMEKLEEFAKQDSRTGYHFQKLEVLEEVKTDLKNP